MGVANAEFAPPHFKMRCVFGYVFAPPENH